MIKRTITAVVAFLIFLPILIFSGNLPWLFTGTMALLSLIATYEICKCFGIQSTYFISIPSYVFVCLESGLLIYKNCNQTFYEGKYAIAAIGLAFLYLFCVFTASLLSKGKVSFGKAGELLAYIIYIVIGFNSISLMRYASNGGYYYLLIFLGCWLTDIGAYVIGSKFGKHKLIPAISPKKTTEGAIGGMIFGIIIFVIYGIIIHSIYGVSVNYLLLIPLGLAVSIVDQLGDLIASYAKREYGIKDYGTIFPGHGGVMDRFDSAMAVGPFIYFVITVFEIQIFTV